MKEGRLRENREECEGRKVNEKKEKTNGEVKNGKRGRKEWDEGREEKDVQWKEEDESSDEEGNVQRLTGWTEENCADKTKKEKLE